MPELAAYLAQPLVARVATLGPTIRPVWILWEDSCFWWLTGWWNALAQRLADDPVVALVVDTCDLDGMEVPGSRAGTSLASCRGLPARS